MNYMKINTILMRVIAVLLMLVMLSTAAVTGRFARYITSSSGHDSARVAKFDVAHTVTVVDADKAQFSLTVTNNSEVTVKYGVDIFFVNELLANSLEGTLDATTVGLSADNKTLAFGDIGQLAPGASASHHLTFTVKDWKLITEDSEGEEASKAFDFKAAVTAVQID